jgi:GNAT superfamily N-acetyltransferase
MDLHLLRAALAHFIGQTLTPEVAGRIEFIATGNEDLAHDPKKFQPLTVGDYVIQVERLKDIVDELHALHVPHWSETERHRHGIPLDVDYPAMLADERAGRLIQFTVRELREMTLVGNLRAYVLMSRHTKTLFAHEDTLFVAPAHRGGFLAMRLLDYAEHVLVDQLGVREIRADSKLVNRADVLMRRRKYMAVSTGFVKIFPEKEQQCDAAR